MSSPELSAWALVVSFALLACGRPAAEIVREALENRPTHDADPEGENPDRGHWIDLRGEPFHPEWVGGRLVVGRGSLPRTLNPGRATGQDELLLVRKFLAPPLLEVDVRGSDPSRLVPVVAASVPVVDGNAVRWHLRTDLTWPDGSPLTTRDVEFSWRVTRDPAFVPPAVTAEMGPVARLEVHDAYTFTVFYERPYFRAVVGFGESFRILPAYATPTDPKEFAAALALPGHGPYEVSERDEARVVLRLRDCFRGKPHPLRPFYVEEFEWRMVKGEVSTLAQLMAGELDIALVPFARWPELMASSTFTEKCWTTFVSVPSYVFLGWNHRDPRDASRPHPVLSDVRVRRALSRLIPRDALNESQFAGRGRLSNGPFLPGDPASDPGIPVTTLDPARAGRELDEAGYRKRADGWRWKGDRKLSLKLLVPTTGALKAMADMLAGEGASVGVEFSVDAVDPSAFLQRLSAADFDAAGSFWRSDLVDADLTTQFHSAHAGQPTNPFRFTDGRVDHLLEAHVRAIDPSERLAVARALHRRLDELQVHAFVLATASPLAMPRRWSNVRVGPLGYDFGDFVLRELRR